MTLVFGVPLSVLLGQLLLGLINGAFYALLSLGLAIIFGLLRIINFAHGAQYMLGAFVAFLGLNYLGVSYWFALVLAPLVVGCLGMAIERGLLRRIAGEDHLYGLLLTLPRLYSACLRWLTRWAARKASCPLAVSRPGL